ncbi:MAG: hypothetical protein Q9192_005925 [Flavoplaca navasiana]
MPVMSTSRRKNPPRSKARAEGKAGRQKAKRARGPKKAGSKQSVQMSQNPAIKTVAESTSRPVVNENPGPDVNENSSEHDDPKAAPAGQGIDTPQTVPQPSTHSERNMPRLQDQVEASKRDGDEEAWKAKRKLAAQKLTKASKAVEKANAQLKKEIKSKESGVEKLIMAGEARVNHARVVMGRSETRIARIVESESAMVGEVIKTGDAKIAGARRALQTAEDNKNLAYEGMQGILAMLGTLTEKSGDARDTDEVDGIDDDAD